MTDPITIDGPEQAKVDPTLPDAGLPPAVGVRSYQVFRASKDVPDITDKKGWTYHHHVDMACWKSRLYVGWNACEKDEDVWPSRELFSSSADGITWSEPAEMFPQGISTPLRMYFYCSPGGRMLVIAGLRVDTKDTDEDTKGGLVVRELRADHTLGEVFALRAVNKTATIPHFETSREAGFVEGCRQLLADNVFLEQQDRGRLLGDRHMEWHDPSAWPDKKVPGNNDKWVFGKAFSFYRRGDNELVGISKLCFVTTSSDNGKTWTMPVRPATLISGGAKVWSQRTSDGRYTLVYNPSLSARHPLIVVHSDDGKHFRDMRIVQGELPVQRYAGLHRTIGPQYVRGISHWSDDGSRRGDKAMWLVYSMSKEDIWVSCVPLPVNDENLGAWNVYSPKWAPVTIDEHDNVTLEDRDPHDYASVTRVLGNQTKVTVSFDITIDQPGPAGLKADVFSAFGSHRPIMLKLSEGGTYAISADAKSKRYSVTLNGKSLVSDAPFAEPADVLHRITFRTGACHGIGGAKPVPAGSDRPVAPARYRIEGFRIIEG